MGFRGIDIRETGDRLVFRVQLHDSAGAIVTSGTANLRLYELQSDGTMKSFDWNDGTFKTTALTTEHQAMTHRQGNNGSRNTGLWTHALTNLAGFVAGNIYLAQVDHTGASPAVQSREFQFGSGVLADVQLWRGSVPAVLADTDKVPASVQHDGITLAKQAKLDTLHDVRLTAARAANLDEITPGRLAELDPGNIPTDLATIDDFVDELETRLTATRATYLDNLSAGPVATAAAVAAIQNNTRTTISLPIPFERPGSGATRFKIYLNNYDSIGNMEEPDAAPTVAVVNEEGVDRSGNLQHPTTHIAQTTMVKIEDGRYWIEYNCASSHSIEQLNFTFSITEGGATRKIDRATMVADTDFIGFGSSDRTLLTDVHNKLPSKSKLTGTNNADGDVQLDEATGALQSVAAAVSAAIRDAVLDRVLAGNHDGAGTAGKILQAITEARLAELDAGNLPADVAAVKSDTAAILADTGTDGVILTAAERTAITAVILDLADAIYPGITVRKGLRLLVSADGGKTNGALGPTFNVRNPGDTKNVIAATVDGSGNRTAMTLDLD